MRGTKPYLIHHRLVRKLTATLSLTAMLTSVLAMGLSAQSRKPAPSKPASRLTAEQRIVHILNRLGFGARPGDVERVRAMGVDKYIEQQLFPEKIDDSASEARLQNLDSLRLSTAELYQKYPQPNQLLQQLQRRNALPADLAAARENRVKGDAKTVDPAKTADTTAGEMQNPANAPNAKPATAANDANPVNNAEYRRAVMEYYRENNLRPAQFLTGELQMSRILRAVYSERQLQEVMVDFWTNHFNVFSGKGADRWLLPAFDRETIRPNALTKFSTLLDATAQSPAMLFYLDNVQSVSPNQQPQQRPGAARG